LDKFPYPILKFEKEDAANLLVSMMEMLLRMQRCPESWKKGKVVILPKPCDESEKNKPENWRPITLTNIFYRIIFGRISEYFQQMHKRKTADGNRIVCKKQKWFIKNINGCCEHSARLCYLITHAMAKKRKLYIAALDCRDAFGSVSHQLLNKNLEKLGVPKRLKNLIMDSYKDSQVRIWSNGKASEPISIKKGLYFR
jgi:hypothetical protein